MTIKKYGTYNHFNRFNVIRKPSYEYTKEENETLDELINLVSDSNSFTFISRLYFKDEVKRQTRRYRNPIYLEVCLERQLQITNCAYELTLEYNKNPTWLNFILKNDRCNTDE